MMEPRLLPKEDNASTSNNHINSVITRQYEFGGETFYFSLHPELYPESDSLDFTGRYLAVLLSIRGLETFYLAPDEMGSYIMDDEDSAGANQIDLEIEDLLQDIEGVHTEDDDPETIENEDGENFVSAEDENQVINWIEFDSEALLLPLMNQAINEHRSGR